MHNLKIIILSSCDLWPWYVTYKLSDIWRFPCCNCIYDPIFIAILYGEVIANVDRQTQTKDAAIIIRPFLLENLHCKNGETLMFRITHGHYEIHNNGRFQVHGFCFKNVPGPGVPGHTGFYSHLPATVNLQSPPKIFLQHSQMKMCEVLRSVSNSPKRSKLWLTHNVSCGPSGKTGMVES